VSVASQLVDPLTCTPISGATIAAIGADGVPISGAAAVTGSDGTFAMCVPSGTPFSISITAAASPLTYSAEAIAGGGFDGEFAQLSLVDNAEVGAFASLLPTALTPGDALILAKVTGVSGCDDIAGWSFAVTLPDGGALPDGGYQLVYFGNNYLPDPAATATSSFGAALIYNIDEATSPFLAVTATNPDGGDCVPINDEIGYTGRLFVTGGAATTDVFILGTNVPAAICPSAALPPKQTVCGAGDAPFSSQVAGGPRPCKGFSGESITAIGGDGMLLPATAMTDPNGVFSLCLPAGLPFTLGVPAASPLPLFTAECLNNDAGCLPQVTYPYAIPTTLAQTADPNKGMVEVDRLPFGAGRLDCPLGGWSLGLTLPDGGPVPDGGYVLVYFDSDSNPDPQATATIGGPAYFYDIDTTISQFFVVTASNPDAGTCQAINRSLGMTGRVFVAPSAETIYLLVLP
jgi:hypothetical protein